MSGHRIFVGHSSAAAAPQTYDESGAFGAVAEIAGEALVELQIGGTFETQSTGDGTAMLDLVEAGDFGSVVGCDGDAVVIGEEVEPPVEPPVEETEPPMLGAWAFPGWSRKPLPTPTEIAITITGGSKMVSRCHGRAGLIRSPMMISGGSQARVAMCGCARLGGPMSGGSRMSTRLEPWERPNAAEENELLVTLLLGEIR